MPATQRRILQVNAPYYKYIIVRLALEKLQNGDRFCFGRIDFSNAENRPDDLTYDYGDFRLLQMVLKIQDAPELLDAIFARGILAIDGSGINLEIAGPGLDRFIPSGFPFANIQPEWPTYYCNTRAEGNRMIPYRELTANSKLPFYPSNVLAVEDFMGLTQTKGNVASDLILLFPDSPWSSMR